MRNELSSFEFKASLSSHVFEETVWWILSVTTCANGGVCVSFWRRKSSPLCIREAGKIVCLITFFKYQTVCKDRIIYFVCWYEVN